MIPLKKRFLKWIDDNYYISSCLQFLHIRDTREKQTEFRTVFVNNIRPDEYEGPDPLDYTTNMIKTSKYTFWNFLPKNLFEQFRRVANFYFLINLIIIFSIPDPPTSPYASMVPILFVVIVTAVKQAYEDVLRHRSDKEINNLPVKILRDGQFTELKWKDIVCGDIIEIMADQPFPCDILLLYSTADDDKCFITTANLDGETNLKQRGVPPKIPEIRNEEDLANLRAAIQYEKPNTKLYEFNGKLIINGEQLPIVNDNILLRGCCLRVAPSIYGCAIYTGKDTKMMRNSKFKSNKLSCIERRLNEFIGVFLIFLAVLTLTSFGLSFTTVDIYKNNWYLFGREPTYYTSNRNTYYFVVFIFYMNLYNYIVPLSMYVTIELQRFVGSQFIEWDMEMYDPKTDQPAKANTSDLNEDLGQIEYLFSDKTGTLTENEMEFKQFSIDGVAYQEKNGELYSLGSTQPIDIMANKKIIEVLECLTFCHTVQIDNSAKEIYQASSPDEFCFIKFCAKLGILFEGDIKDNSTQKLMRTVKFLNNYKRYELLEVLEFDSTRKRMSVILKDPETRRIVMYCKGAESFVLKKCTSGDIQTCNADIQRFAEQGWRTLALSKKEFDEADYLNSKNLLNSAYNDILNRNEKMAEAFDAIESDLALVGATGIEDKLQENVADTLETIRQAGIKVWVLTGDKKETAINISGSCKHFSKDMEKLIITDLTDVNQIKDRLKQFRNKIAESEGKNRVFALVIDGSTLGVLFGHNLDDPFREICMKCEAVLCCRMSPAQKAEVVKLVKKSKRKPMTAAIGDGANDVSMIQEAHVGLGIFGKEGRNAARSADFAFAKFKFAKQIILVHGFLYYTRSSYLVQYFFYKNLAFVICQFYYAFFNAFSVTSLYDSIVLTFYNVTFTAAPILLFGLFEQKVGIDELRKNPYLYRTIKRNKLLRAREFLKWNIMAIWHSLVAFFVGYAMFASQAPFSSDGKLSGTAQLGAYVITITLVIVHAKLLLEWQYKTYFLLIGFALSILSYSVLCLLINAFLVVSFFTSFTDGQTMYWVYFNLMGNVSIWLSFLLAVVTALIPDVILKIIELIKNNESIRKLKELELERVNKFNFNNGLTTNKTNNFSDNLKYKNRQVNDEISLGNINNNNKDESNYSIYNDEDIKSPIRVFVVPPANKRITNTKVFQRTKNNKVGNKETSSNLSDSSISNNSNNKKNYSYDDDEEGGNDGGDDGGRGDDNISDRF